MNIKKSFRAIFHKLFKKPECEQLLEAAFLQLKEQENMIAQLKKQHQMEMDDQLNELIITQEKLNNAFIDKQILQIRLEQLQQNAADLDKSLLSCGQEADKYHGETLDAVLYAIRLHAESLSNNTRKFHVLNTILEHNPDDGTRNKLIETLALIFKGYDGTTPKIRADLKKIGLEISEEGEHNHIQFINDKRFKVSIAKTPSDMGRVDKNIVRDIKQKLL